MSENEYLPYKTINVYIDRQYLEDLVKSILNNKESLPKEDQIAFAKTFKKYVTILGFRNVTRAPLPLQVNAYADAFEEKEEVIPFTLSTWTKLRPDLAEKVKSWLESQGWENLAMKREYSETDGFINEWPEDLSLDQLVADFTKAYPDEEYLRDDMILMVLWISGRLPQDQTEL